MERYFAEMSDSTEQAILAITNDDGAMSITVTVVAADGTRDARVIPLSRHQAERALDSLTAMLRRAPC